MGVISWLINQLISPILYVLSLRRQGMTYPKILEVHSNRVLHRDLKPSNVMLTRPHWRSPIAAWGQSIPPPIFRWWKHGEQLRLRWLDPCLADFLRLAVNSRFFFSWQTWTPLYVSLCHDVCLEIQEEDSAEIAEMTIGPCPCKLHLRIVGLHYFKSSFF